MEKTFLMKMVHFEVPDEFPNRKNILVGHSCNAWCALLALFSLSMGLGVSSLGVSSVIKNVRLTGELLCDGLYIIIAGLPMFCVAYFIFKHMKNSAIIIYDEGIWYRRVSGKCSTYMNHEIRGWTSYTREYIAIITNYGDILRVGSDSKNYWKIRELIQQKYPQI